MNWFRRIRGDGAEEQRRRDTGDDTAQQLPGDVSRFLPGGAPAAFRVTKTLAGMHPTSGKRIFRSGAGMSLSSREEAERLAEAQARRALDAAIGSRGGAVDAYAYLVDRRLEPLVEVLRGPTGDSALITVNGYGALVMNASRALFVDVDGDGDDAPQPRLDERPPRELDEGLAARPDLRFRTYRTRAGWRLLCTNQVFDPAAAETERLLQDLGADPKYVVLCRVQRCFRARLTPKPWRTPKLGRRELTRARDVGRAPTLGVSRDDLQRYVDKTWDYATARFVGGAERADIALELQPLVDYHDRWTQATSGKPLA